MSVIDSVRHQSDKHVILDMISKAIGRYDLGEFIVSDLPDRGMDVAPLILLSGWDGEWLRRYLSLDYIQYDPVARRCFATHMPFEWSEAFRAMPQNSQTWCMVDDARQFGLENGYCIPVHMADGRVGAVSFSGEPRALDGRARQALHMLAIYLHSHLRDLRSPAGSGEAQTRAITPREREILRWVADGKTTDEIAEITGLAARTVNQHCENAQSRLGTKNRLHTVVEAIRNKLVPL